MNSSLEKVEKLFPNGDCEAEWRKELSILHFTFFISFCLGYNWDFPCMRHTEGKFSQTNMFWMWYFQNQGFPSCSAVNNQPAMQEIQVQPLGWEDILEKEMATHSNILAWEIPLTEKPGEKTLDMTQRLNSSINILRIKKVLSTE